MAGMRGPRRSFIWISSDTPANGCWNLGLMGQELWPNGRPTGAGPDGVARSRRGCLSGCDGRRRSGARGAVRTGGPRPWPGLYPGSLHAGARRGAVGPDAGTVPAARRHGGLSGADLRGRAHNYAAGRRRRGRSLCANSERATDSYRRNVVRLVSFATAFLHPGSTGRSVGWSTVLGGTTPMTGGARSEDLRRAMADTPARLPARAERVPEARLIWRGADRPDPVRRPQSADTPAP